MTVIALHRPVHADLAACGLSRPAPDSPVFDRYLYGLRPDEMVRDRWCDAFCDDVGFAYHAGLDTLVWMTRRPGHPVPDGVGAPLRVGVPDALRRLSAQGHWFSHLKLLLDDGWSGNLDAHRALRLVAGGDGTVRAFAGWAGGRRLQWHESGFAYGDPDVERDAFVLLCAIAGAPF